MAEHRDVIVIGGGPGGAAAATFLCQRGYRPLVLERQQFPRFHIGESLLPASQPVLERMGIAEELQLRLFLLSLLALGLRGLGRLAGANQRVLLPVWAFWGANVIAAVLFGLGHLPATAALIPITGVVVVRAVVLNGTAALAFGWLFRRNGIETAMVAHFVADVVLLVIAPLILVEGSLP